MVRSVGTGWWSGTVGRSVRSKGWRVLFNATSTLASYPVQVGNPILQTHRFCVGTHKLETVKEVRANGADIRVPRKPTTMALDVLS